MMQVIMYLLWGYKREERKSTSLAKHKQVRKTKVVFSSGRTTIISDNEVSL
jgi:hypothetical protein